MTKSLHTSSAKCRKMTYTLSAMIKLSFGYTDSPQFLEPMQEVTVSGYVTTLWCQAQGSPAPVITWIKNETVLQNTTSVTYEQQRDAQGVYKCMASNLFGATQQKTLRVYRQGSCLLSVNRQFKYRVYVNGKCEFVPRDRVSHWAVITSTHKLAVSRNFLSMSCFYLLIIWSFPYYFKLWSWVKTLIIKYTELNC